MWFPSAVKSATGRVEGLARYILTGIKRRTGSRPRLRAARRTYQIPDGVRIIPAAAVPSISNTYSTAITPSGRPPADINSAGPTVNYLPDQYAQIEISAAATGARWEGVAIRICDDGQAAYVGLHKTGRRKSELILCKRIGGEWIRLGRTYRTRPFVDGTRLRLVALGSTIALIENEMLRVAACDTGLSGGIPGRIVSDSGVPREMTAGSASFEVYELSNDARGIITYKVISAANSGGPRLLRVLRPTRPNPAMAHNFLFVLPVEEEMQDVYGNGLHTLQSLDAHNEYNLTIIEPSFGIQPWYADNPTDPDIRYETFMAMELVPWVRASLAITGDEQNWLIGFSKSGLGGHLLLLKHPDLFDLAASWDFPAEMSVYDEFELSSAACYGADGNFQANYRLTSEFAYAHSAPFRRDCRIWIGQGPVFMKSVSRYEEMLSAAGVRYKTGKALGSPHRWDGGWIPAALAELKQSSTSWRGQSD